MPDPSHEHAPVASQKPVGTSDKTNNPAPANDQQHDQSHLDRIWSKPSKQSRAFGAMFSFEPESLNFDGAGSEQVRIKNTTDTTQTIDDWELVGDASAFETSFVGHRSVVIQPGETKVFQVRFVSADDQVRAASLIVRSSFDQTSPSRLNITGIKRGAPKAHECTGVQIQQTTREGRPNSINSAMSSVGAALNAVAMQQKEGISQVEQRVGSQIPKKPPAWGKTFDAFVAEGLVRAVTAAGDYLSAGVANATYTALLRVRADWTGILLEKRLVALNKQVHDALMTSVAKGITASGIGLAREQIMTNLANEDVVPAAMRDAFFHAQTRTLSMVYADAVTSLNNSEGDYAALEAEAPGLAFTALEAYRQHLLCAERIGAIMQNHTLGLWSAFLARMAIGTHEPESWENAKSGAALEKNIYKSTDARHRMRDVARGVLEIGVVWSYDHRRDAPISEIRHARVEGLQDDLKNMLLNAPLGEFHIPMIVHGKVVSSSYAPQSQRPKTTELRIARNDGGGITVAAEDGTASAEMLQDLGGGDAYAGARALFAHVDQLVLSKVE